MTNLSVLNRVLNSQNELSPKLARLARYLEAHRQDVAFLGARDLALQAGVSEATVTRLAYACGFSGYSELKAAIKAEVQQKLSLKKHVPSKKLSLFSEVVNMERELLDEMERDLDQDDFTQAVEDIYQADRVLVVGCHPNTMLAEYLACFLSPIKKNVFLVTELNNLCFNHIRNCQPGNLCIAYCFPRYAKHTMIIVDELKKCGARVIGISDSTFSPLAKTSDLHFVAPAKYLSYVDPAAAVMALNHALITGVLVRDAENYHSHVQAYDQYLTGKDIFLEKELDIVALNALQMALKPNKKS